MNKKIFVFDMDGVLFDTIPYAEQTTLESYPGMTSSMYKELHSGNYFEELAKHSQRKKVVSEEEEMRRQLEYSEKKKGSTLFEGIEAFLKGLYRAGHTLVLNTNAFEKNCLPLLEQTNIKYVFDFIATAELSKSKVVKFKLIEEKYGTNKEDILFITDALGDIKEAEIAGISSLAVTWGVHDRSFFTREKHSHLVGIMNTVAELRGYLLH